jgi:hypothetical protein
LSPYSSHLVAKRTGTFKKLKDEIDVVLEMAMIVINDVIELPRTVTGNAKVAGSLSNEEFIKSWQIRPGLMSAACVYEEERPVTWLPTGATKDRLHHLLMVTMTIDGLMLLTTTDAEHRAVLLQHLKASYFDDWKPVPQAVLIKAMVENEQLKTLWLAGIHRDTSIKPSSKILSGSNLRDAIDPMNDSSYHAGAVRSTKGGVSLRNSSVWTGPNASLVAFENRSVILLAAVDAAFKAKPTIELQVHTVLGTWISDISKAKDCYFIAHADPETMDGDRGKAAAEALSDQFLLELSNPSAPAGMPAWAFSARVTEISTKLSAVVTVVPSIVDESVVYAISSTPPPPFDVWATAVEESSALLRTYYDSGHTIAGGALAMVRVRDLPFSKFVYGNFSRYDVTQEKPPAPTKTVKGKKVITGPVPLQNMMTDPDQSLFKWIFKEGLTFLDLNLPSPNKCWLYCDDGSSEVADFVHLDIITNPKRLTLFHAKGASSYSASRQTAPGPYELVASQAIKNLRAFDSQQLLGRIENRLKTNGAERIWDKPWQHNLKPMPNAVAFQNALKTLGTNVKCEVIIVQPHVRRSDFTKRVGHSDTVGARQLRTLLFGVESVSRAVNADFRVVADNI